MKIPIRFKLFAQTINVIFSPESFTEKDGHYGFAAYRSNQIQLRPSVATHPLTEEQIEQTFCHELMHFVFYHAGSAYKGNKDYMHQDEGFVELCGCLLHQAFSTMEFENPPKFNPSTS